MPYPPPPWTLRGSAFLSLHLVDRARAQSLVPPELHVLSVFPGKTLAGVYLASYGPGSTLEYHELIVVAALVRDGNRPGFWVSHIYVDNPDSVAGGREIWGLPKELAEFQWLGERRAVVRQGDRRLCVVDHGPSVRTLWLPWVVPTFSTRGSDLLFFAGKVESRVRLAMGRVEIPEESPLVTVGLGSSLLTFMHDGLRLVVPGPRVVGRAGTVMGAEQGLFPLE